jgi:NADH:ubiquinone oxidoreductase subunit 6 (subunit J)
MEFLRFCASHRSVCTLERCQSYKESCFACAAVFMFVTDSQVRQAQVVVDVSALWRVNLVSMLTHSGFSSRLCSEGLGFVSVVILQVILLSSIVLTYFTCCTKQSVSFQHKMQRCHFKSTNKIHGASLVIMNFYLYMFCILKNTPIN